MRKVKVHRIILCPDFVVSRHDGDRHFIGAQQLSHLYGVLPTDIVKVFNGRMPIPKDQKMREGWKELWPRNDGEYYDIHATDNMEHTALKF